MSIQKIVTVTFDPSLKAHRLAVRAFMRRKAWVDSPIRFSHDPTFGSIADQVQIRLLEWYLAREPNDKSSKVIQTSL